MADGGSETARRAVMSLVIRVERESPPDRTDALEAIAPVVLRVWSDLTVAQRREQLIATWTASPRIVVRRARAVSWQRVASMRAVHVRLRTAEVIGFPISWTDEVPTVIGQLPVTGTELHSGHSSSLSAAPGTATLHLNPTLNMSTGKQMAQVGHGALALLEWLPEADRLAWADASYPLIVRTPDSPTWRRLRGAGLPEVRDAGHTEIARGSLTVIAEYARRWPTV